MPLSSSLSLVVLAYILCHISLQTTVTKDEIAGCVRGKYRSSTWLAVNPSSWEFEYGLCGHMTVIWCNPIWNLKISTCRIKLNGMAQNVYLDVINVDFWLQVYILLIFCVMWCVIYLHLQQDSSKICQKGCHTFFLFMNLILATISHGISLCFILFFLKPHQRLYKLITRFILHRNVAS